MTGNKKLLSVLLAAALVITSIGAGLGYFALKTEALTGGSFRVYAETCPNNTKYGLDQGTYDDVYIRFFTDVNAGGTLLYTSQRLAGIDHGGESGSINFQWSPPVTIKSLQVHQVGSDSWGAMKTIVYYTPDGGTEQAVWTSGDDYNDFDGGEDYNVNINWFNVDHNRSLTFNGNGATGGSTGQLNLVWGTLENLPANGFTRTGYTFAGWATTAGGSVAYSNQANYGPMPDSNQVLYAKWTANYYNMAFDANGGNGSSSGPQQYEAAVAVPSVTKTGYTLSGWVPAMPATVPLNGGSYLAQWTANTYYVAYNANGGSGSMANSTHTYDTAKALTGNTFTKTGHSFQGWAASSGGGVQWVNYASVTNLTATANATVTLYAIWNADTYQVTFNANGGNGSMTPQNIVFGQTASLSSNSFTRTGYTFAGWATTAGGNVAYENAAPYTMSTIGATLYAKWEPNTYTVEYHPNGGSGTTASSQHMYDSQKTLTANGYTKAGYSFTGWSTVLGGAVVYYDGQSVLNLSAAAGATVTLYAVWASNPYTVTYDAQGGTVSPAGKTVIFGSLYDTLPVPSKTGYTFAGWFTVPSGGGVQVLASTTVSIPSNHTIYAYWLPNTYSVIYDGNGADAGSTTTSAHIYDEAKALSLNGFSRTGYTFSGWAQTTGGAVAFTNGQSVMNLTSVQGATVTLYAKWTANAVYTIVYNANGGEGITQSTTHVYDVPATLRMNAFVRTGYTFTGWAATPGGSAIYVDGQSVLNLSSVNGAVVTLYAKWTPLTYIVTFDYQDEGITLNSTVTYDSTYGSGTGGWPTPTLTGHAFQGWWTATGGGGNQRFENTIVELQAAETLYAYWIPNTYNVIYDGNGATAGSMANQPILFGTASALYSNNFTRVGHSFTGWATTAGGAISYSNGANYTMLTEGATLYAKWSVNNYTINFDENGGSTVANLTRPYNTGVSEPAAPSKTGYTFSGWYLDSLLTTPVLWPYTIGAGNITFYAKWTGISYTVGYLSNGGDGGATAGSSHIYGLAQSLTKNGFTRTGYSFTGWSVNPSATEPSYADEESVLNLTAVPGGTVTFYAVWAANTYQLLFDGSGSTGGSMTEQSIVYGQSANLSSNAFTKLGCTFEGWATQAGGSVAYEDEASYTMLTTGATLYAVWAASHYTVVYDINDNNFPGWPAAGTTLASQHTYGTPAPLSSNGYTRNGFTFIGWAVSEERADLLTVDFTDTASVVNLTPDDGATVTLYAVWQENPANYTALNQVVTLANASNLPVNAAHDPAYMAPDGEMYLAGEFNNNGFYPRAAFTPASLADLANAVGAVVYALGATQQAAVDGYGVSITAAYQNLALAQADYTGLNAAIAQTEALNRNLYTESSLENVDLYYYASLDAVAAQWQAPLQVWADDLTLMLLDAIAALEYKPADYSGVNQAWASRPDDLFLLYTPASVNALVSYYQTQINWNWKMDNQSIVDGYADSIEALIQALVLNPADYTGVTNALKAIPDGDGGLASIDYAYLQSRYTASSVINLQNTVDAVVYGKMIDEQAKVDTYAANINAARIALVPLEADYSYLAAALLQQPQWDDSYYTDATLLAFHDAKAAGQDLYDAHNLDISQQQVINDAVDAIDTAFAALVLKAVTYTVKCQTAAGVTLRPDETFNGTAADIVSVPAPALTGYTPLQASIQRQLTGTASQNIFAFVYSVNSYTVTFHSNGGSAVPPVTRDYGTQIAQPSEPQKDGHSFAGWYMEETFINAVAWPYTIGAANADFYARWTINSYLITFDADGGTGGTGPVSMVFGSPLEAPTVTRQGYLFDGWDPQVPAAVPAAETVYTAQWMAVNYTISYDGNGAESGTTAESSHTYDLAAALSENGFSRTGYSFTGWSANASAQTPDYTGGQSVINLTDIPDDFITFYAVWAVNYYLVTFDANGGTGSTGPDSLAYGSVLSAPAVAREGYTFTYWAPEVPSTVPPIDSIYTAQWTINQYTVSFDSEGGHAVADITQDYATAVTAPEPPTRTGYTFTGWLPVVPETMPAEDTLCVAQWTINQYNVSFDEAGGSVVADITQDYGTAVTAPEPPSRTGYTFAGWLPLVPETMPAEDTLCVAQWTINQYTVSFDSEGGHAVADITQDYGTAVTAPEPPSRTGYTFAGWLPLVPETMPAEDTLCVAQWTINQYTVNFDEAGGTEVIDITQDFGTAITAPEPPTRTGYTFAGWLPVVPETIPAEDTLCVAQWTANTYTITFNAGEGTGGTVESLTFDTPLTAPAVERIGYTFAGWDPEVPATVPPQDTQYTAQWTANVYTVVYDGNGATDGATVSSSHTYDEPKALTLSGFVRTGYTFAGWQLGAGKAPSGYEDGEVVVNLTEVNGATVTLYAQWTINQYTVSFDSEGGHAVADITQDYASTVTAPEPPTRTGYTFAGWLPQVPETMPAEDTLCVAQWTINQYTVSFDEMGGTPVADITLDYGTAVTAPEPPVKVGYTFAGWLPQVPETMPAEDTLCVAQWSISQFTVTYWANGQIYRTLSLNFGDPIPDDPSLIMPEMAPPVKTGYTLAEWAVPSPTMPANDIMVEAIFTINTYFAVFYVDSVIYESVPTLYNTAIAVPADPAKTGHTFTGWDPVPGTIGAGDEAFNAVFTPNSYIIEFDANGGEGGAGPVSMTFGDALSAPAVTKTGYTFAGWDPEAPSTVPAGDAVYTAQWQINSYHYTFDANGGEGGTAGSLNYGEPLAAPAVAREGYTFEGWEPEVPAAMPAQDQYFTAQWSLITHTVTFDLNGGEGSVPPSQNGAPGTAVALPEQGDITLLHHIFAGWSESAGATEALASYQIGSSDTVLYAVWLDVEVRLAAREGSAAVVDNEGLFLYGLEPGLSRQALEDSFIQILGDGRLEYTRDTVGTGTQLRLFSNVTGMEVAVYTIVIYGDLNGDGNIDSGDAGLACDYENFVVEWDPVEDAELLEAGDLNGDGNIDSSDASIVVDHENFYLTINQVTGLAS